MYMRNIIYLLLFLLLISCSPYGPFYSIEKDIPKGPPDARKGWRDGCSSSISQLTKSVNIALLAKDQYYVDPELIASPLYRKAWYEASYYCVLKFSSGPLDAREGQGDFAKNYRYFETTGSQAWGF